MTAAPPTSDDEDGLAPPPATGAEIARLRQEQQAAIEAIGELRRECAALRRRVNELEERTARGQVRFDATVAFFEHRVDQIYARVLEFLAQRGGAPTAPDELFAAVPMSEVLSVAAADRMRWQLENEHAFLPPGRFEPPLTSFGFRLTLGVAREAEGCIHVAPGGGGVVVYGPYKHLRIGRYRMRWTVAPAEAPGGAPHDLAFDVYSPSADEILGTVRHRGMLEAPVTLDVAAEVTPALDRALFELRAFQFGEEGFRILRLDVIREAN